MILFTYIVYKMEPFENGVETATLGIAVPWKKLETRYKQEPGRLVERNTTSRITGAKIRLILVQRNAVR